MVLGDAAQTTADARGSRMFSDETGASWCHRTRMRLSSILIAASLFGCDQKVRAFAAADAPDPDRERQDRRDQAVGACEAGTASASRCRRSRRIRAARPASRLRSIGFGGLGIDAPRGVAVGADGERLRRAATSTARSISAARSARSRAAGQSSRCVRREDRRPTASSRWAQTWGAKRDDAANAIAVQRRQGRRRRQLPRRRSRSASSRRSAGSDDVVRRRVRHRRQREVGCGTSAASTPTARTRSPRRPTAAG